MKATLQSARQQVPLLGRIVQAEAETRAALAATQLAHSVEELVAAAENGNYTSLMGASQAGSVLCGAAAYTSSLAVWFAGDEPPQRLLLVDCWVAGYAGLDQAAHFAKLVGAGEVDAFVLGAIGDFEVAPLHELGQVWVAGEHAAVLA